jgi:DNA-binding NarL/FixJ family response regulator
MIRVVLAEDHHIVREGIRIFLEEADDIEVVAEADNGQQAVALVQKLMPDVIIMDINMPRLTGLQAAEQILDLALPTRIVILSGHSDKDLIRQALRAGARGYLLKSSPPTELYQAIRTIYQGQIFICPKIAWRVKTDDLAGQGQGAAITNDLERLSPREREVLKLIAEGHTNKAIARILKLSIKTVEKHRSRLMAKLDVHDLAGLVRLALKHGLIFLEE